MNTTPTAILVVELYIMTQPSFIQTLRNKLDELVPMVDLMLNNSSVYYHDHNDDFDDILIVGGNLYHYNKKDEKTQITVKSKYLNFYENFELLLNNAHPDTLEDIKETHSNIIDLIEQNEAPSSIENGKTYFCKLVTTYSKYLDLLSSNKSNVILIPDTNSIVQYPDPIPYRKLVGGEFLFIITPTVLSELDKHKAFHRDEAFRNKVKGIIKRLKGYVKQGDILQGVIVDKNITIKMIATYPTVQLHPKAIV